MQITINSQRLASHKTPPFKTNRCKGRANKQRNKGQQLGRVYRSSLRYPPAMAHKLYSVNSSEDDIPHRRSTPSLTHDGSRSSSSSESSEHGTSDIGLIHRDPSTYDSESQWYKCCLCGYCRLSHSRPWWSIFENPRDAVPAVIAKHRQSARALQVAEQELLRCQKAHTELMQDMQEFSNELVARHFDSEAEDLLAGLRPGSCVPFPAFYCRTLTSISRPSQCHWAL